jgi:hypothetical protein
MLQFITTEAQHAREQHPNDDSFVERRRPNIDPNTNTNTTEAQHARERHPNDDSFVERRRDGGTTYLCPFV